MKRLLPLALLVASFAAADQPAEKKTNNELIQGTWVFVSLERDGKVVKEGFQYEQLKDAKLTFKDDTLKSSLFEKVTVTFALDAAKKPATFDLLIKTDNGTEKAPWLYELKDDTLKLCTGGAPDERPKDFNSKGGQSIVTWKREQKKPEK